MDLGWNDGGSDDEADGAAENNESYGGGGKDAVLFLIDASPQMRQKPDDGNDTPFQMSIRCALATLRRRIFGAPNDVVGVLLYGTMHKVEVRDFNNLGLLLPIEQPEMQAIKTLEDLLLDESAAARSDFERRFGSSETYSLHEALWQSQTLFAGIQGKVGLKKILLFTCNDDPHDDEPGKKRQAMQKARDLRETHIHLEVLPIVEAGGAADKARAFDQTKFFADLTQLSSEEGDDEARDSVSDPVARFDDLLRVTLKRDHKKRALGKFSFDLGKGIRIGVSAFNLVSKASKPPKVRVHQASNEPVKSKRSFIHPLTGAPLLPSDIDKYLEYGGKRIKFTQDEVKGITVMDGQLGLKLCGFKPVSHLKLGQFVRSGYFIYPEEKLIAGSRAAFAALLKRCLARQVMAVCYFKSRDNSGPSFVALVPQDEEKEDGVQSRAPGFNLVFLPFVDDFRPLPRTGAGTEVLFPEPNPEQLDAAKKLVRKLKLKSFHPQAFRNPDLETHYSLIEAFALDRDTVEPVEDTTIPPADRIRKKLGDIAQDFLTNVYDEGYDPVTGKSASASAGKRKAPAAAKDGAAGDAAAKQSKVDMDQFDMAAVVNENSVHKLTADVLKTYLKSVGVVGLALKKKSELADMVYQCFNKKV